MQKLAFCGNDCTECLFDEYMVCVSGQYTVIMNYKEYVLNPGDEIFIPKGNEQWGKCIAGTRTIPAFGGKRIQGA